MNDQFNFNKHFVVLQSDRKKTSDCKKGGRRHSRPPLNPSPDLIIIKSIELLLLKKWMIYRNVDKHLGFVLGFEPYYYYGCVRAHCDVVNISYNLYQQRSSFDIIWKSKYVFDRY